MATRRASESPSRPALAERVLASGCRRVGLLGLHPRAGTRTALASLARGFHGAGRAFGVTSFPRLHVDDVMVPEPVTRVALPGGVVVANGERAELGPGTTVQVVESTRFPSPAGDVGLYRIVEGGELELTGPDDAGDMGAVLSRLADVTGGPALVDGGWSRRAFAAPGITDGLVLCVGAGYSATPERSAAALRFLVDVLNAPECPAEPRAAWPEARDRAEAIALGPGGERVTSWRPGKADPSVEVEPLARRISSIVLPAGLHDDLLAPLVRGPLRCRLVVRDATRVHAAPVWLRAWQKAGGTLQVVHATRVIAVATNPVNFHGDDADRPAFLETVSRALPDLAVHDVVLESDTPRRPIWKFWA